MTVRIKVEVELSFWQALKLRLAGAGDIEGYIKCLIEERGVQRHQDEDDT